MLRKIAVFFIAATLGFASLGLAAATTDGKANLLALGQIAPDFKLTDVLTGETVSRDDFADKKALVVMFICRHCPFVQRVKAGLAALSKDYKDSSAAVVSIASNDASFYPEDGPASLKEMALEEGFAMPLLYDESQAVAKAYTAVATPDIFVFNKDRQLVYRGQFDGARPGNDEPVTGHDVRAAIEAVLADKPVAQLQKPAIGCSIKWKKGNEPAYAI